MNSRAGYPTYTLSRGASSPLEYFSTVNKYFYTALKIKRLFCRRQTTAEASF